MSDLEMDGVLDHFKMLRGFYQGLPSAQPNMIS